MKGVYLRDDSPFYWFRYYDKYENLKSKRKSITTKIEATENDWQRKKVNQPLLGTPKLRELVKAFRVGMANRDIENKSGVKLRFDVLLSDGYEEFKKLKSTPGIKNGLKEKTILCYDLAVDHMIKACGDKKIYKYSSEKDYVDLLNYFDEIKIPKKIENPKTGKNEIVNQKLSINSRSIYTRSLKSLWNYFLDKNYCSKNIIEAVDAEDVDPDPIPLDEMFAIIKYFQADTEYPHHYWLVYFLLLTGCRPSSAMEQLVEHIDFKRKRIKIKNVKTGRNKKKLFYPFPLYKELGSLLREMKFNPEAKGRLFRQYKLNPLSYTSPLSFWERGIKVLKIAKHISNYYTLKQIRSTTASFMINVLGMKVLSVKRLLDHTDIKITDKHYISLNLKVVREEMDDFTIDKFLDEENNETA